MKAANRTILALLTACVVLASQAGAQPCGTPTPPVHRWTGDGTADDAQGGNHGSLANGASFGAGVLSQSFELDGIDDHVSMPNVVSHYPSGSFTGAAWVRTDNASETLTVLSKYECGWTCRSPASSVYFIQIDEGVPLVYVRDVNSGGPDTGGLAVPGGTSVADGLWHHVVGIRDVDSDTLRLYVDGVLAGEEALGVGSSDVLQDTDGESDPIVIGALGSPGVPGAFVGHFEGSIDDVRYYDSALDPVEVFDLYATTDCATGSVNLGVGTAAEVLSVNGSSCPAVTTPVNTPIEVTLSAPPAGPAQARYLLFAWICGTRTPVELTAQGESLGCFMNPTPLQPGLSPQPFRCIRGSGLPAGLCFGVVTINGPSKAPWTLSKPGGLANPITLGLQGLLEDAGSAATAGFSVTNGIVLRVE